MAHQQNPKSITALNALILFSLLTLPTLTILTYNNITGIAQTINLEDTKQIYTQNKLTMSATLILTNPGPFKAEAKIEATLRDTHGNEYPIKGPKLIFPQGTHKVPVELTVDLANLQEDQLQNLALNQDDLTLTAVAMVGLQSIVSITADTMTTIHWMPPLHNLTINEPRLTSITPTQIMIETQVSFENQSPMQLNADLIVKITDSNSQQVGGGALAIIVDPVSRYSQPLQLNITPPAKMDPLTDQTYSYTVTPKLTLSDYNLTYPIDQQKIQIQWGALIKNLQYTNTITPIDSKNSLITYDITYTNNNQYIPLDAAITPKIMKGSETILSGHTQTVYTNPGSQGSISGQITIPNSDVLQGNLELVLQVSTNYGNYNMEVGTLG
jgi:hypothetical protein